MRIFVLLALLSLAFSQAVKSDDLDFESFQLGISPQGGFSIKMKGSELASGMLFFERKGADKADWRYFQNSSMIKNTISPKFSLVGEDAVISLSGKMKNKAIEAEIPFSQTIRITPNGTLKFNYELQVPLDWEFGRNAPEVLLHLPIAAVGGKGLWYQTSKKEEWKVIDKSYRKGVNLHANHLKRLKVATDFGPLDFIPLSGAVRFQDTRHYSKNGSIRVDLLGKQEKEKWSISFTIKVPVSSIKIPSEILDCEVAKFKPDFKTWDIYLPYLDRTHLSGWWKLKLLAKTEDNPDDDQGTKEKFYAKDFNDSKWNKVVVPSDWHRPFMAKGEGLKTFGGVGWYRLNFVAPEIPNGKRAILHFDEVVRKADIFLNGKKVGNHVNYRLDGMRTTWEGFEIDVTDAILPGKENVLALRVYCSGKPLYWGNAQRGGITGRVYLDVKPAAYCEEMLVTPAENLQAIDYECLIKNTGKQALLDDWTAEVFEWNSEKIVAKANCPKPETQDGQLFISGNLGISNPQLWSCESPFLYGLRIKNKSGVITGIKRFGMRTFQVKNGAFLLNGKPTCLRGLCVSESDFTRRFRQNGYIFVQNEGDAFKRYFKTLRDANINHIRTHTSIMTPSAYDVFDELGFLIADEINYPYNSIKNSKIATKISHQNIDYACKENGKLRPEFIKRIVKRLRHLYSHPSVATFSFGNEMRGEGQCGKMFNNLYDLYKKIDRQNRPLTPSSGRFWKSGNNMASLSKIDKLDYIDTHDYTGSINNWPVAFCQPVAENLVRIAEKNYGEKLPPMINGETVYFADKYYPQFFDKIWKSESDAEPNWEKYLWALTEMGKKYSGHKKMSYYWVRNWGTKKFKYDLEKGRGIYTEKILDVQRKMWPVLDGFEVLSGRYFSKPSPVFPLSEAKPVPNEAYEYLRQVCAPAVLVLDYIAPNRYAGEKMESVTHVINNSEKELSGAKVMISIQGCGETIKTKELSIGKLPVGEKKVIPFSIDMPDSKGAFTLNYKLIDGAETLCDRKLDLNVRIREQVFAPIKTDKKIFVYDGVEKVFTGMGRPSTSKLLKAFDLSFTPISNFDDLVKCDLLIIGANSIDTNLENNAYKIQQYLEAGGKALVFEQCKMGRIPFLRELEYVRAGSGQFAEKVRQYHPSVNGMSQNEFFCWNQKDWAIYHSFISPLSEATVLAGGDSGSQWGAENFGMVVAHLKVGKGLLLLSQADITSIFEIDSSAAKLARNLLLVALDDKANRHAKKFRGKAVIVQPLMKKNAIYFSLAPAANMAFADQEAGDGKGGWTDQGPKNDLRQIPIGLNVLNGVPFEILDPASNNDKSCVVVSGNKSLPFKPVSSPIPIAKKVKRLIFLHTGAWMGGKNAPAGKYVVRYSSGKTIEIPLIIGKQIADWWGAGSNLTQAECFWSSNNGSSLIGAFGYSWTNPEPNEEIANITVESIGKTVIGLLALTGEKN